MKSTRIFLYTLALVACLSAVSAARGDDVYTKEIEVEPGQTIWLEMDEGGSLTVEGWDRDAVRIECETNINSLEDYDFDSRKTAKGIRFSADLTRRSQSTDLEVVLKVPHRFNIKTESAGGSINITDVEGEFSGRTGGGRICLTNVNGEANLKTGGGKIKVVDCELDGRISTGGSGALVKNVVGDVEVSSGGGIVKYENVRDRDGNLRVQKGLRSHGHDSHWDHKRHSKHWDHDDHNDGHRTVNIFHGDDMEDDFIADILTEGTILQSTAGGSIRIKSAPDGAILQTGGGDIRVTNAKRIVKAQTGGGDIEVEVQDGSIIATTGAGEIVAVVERGFGKVDGGCILSTGHGDITVTLPEDASVELDLDLSYTRNSSRDFRIDSDFDLEEENTKKWDSSHGTPRKHIYGTANLGGGDNVVRISTVNGNIRIKKGK